MRTLVLLAALPLAAYAEPIVTGFDRFHSQPTAEAGRLLYNELGCVNCHGGETGLPVRRGPVLAGVTSRSHSEWLKEFIAEPAKAKPGTMMPHVVSLDDAEAVLHYLNALPVKVVKPKGAKYMNAERGSDVYHTAGCVACHQPGKDYQSPAGNPKPSDYTHRSVPLPDLKTKYSLGSLMAFLSDPLKVRTDGRMPHIKVHDADVTDLAAFLLDLQQSDGSNVPGIKSFKSDAALAAKGKVVVQSARCASCHDLPKDVQVPVLPLKQGTGGCLDSAPGKGLPGYGLSEAQRQALSVYLAKREETLKPKEQVALILQALNCTQCHDREVLGGPDAARRVFFTGDHNLGDTGLLPPPLTSVGRKLQSAWLADVLKGKARVRPYLQTQMPNYGSATDALAQLFASADHRDEKPLPTGDAEAGRKLLGTQGGIGCITCHRWDKRPSLGIQALDLSTLAQRVQPGWFREYLINPAGYRAGTLMPSFWPGGQASNQTILKGDAEAQMASLLAFAKEGKGEPEGYPANQAGEFELLPKDRPIVQRTFMKDVGAQAILVGFPAGLHIAYDAKQCRPALVWKGKFFDAYSTWFSREAPFESPLGDIVGRWPAVSEGEAPRRFAGYKLDAAGVPTFLVEVNGSRVEERFEPKDGRLHRFVSGKGLEVSLSHPPEATVTEAPDSKPEAKHFIYSWK